MPHCQQDFLEVFLPAEKRLYTYLVTLLPRLDDADEVFQQTSLLLWKKWSTYDRERDFLKWACGIAYIEAKRYLAERGRAGETLGDEAAEIMAETARNSARQVDQRLEALRDCVQRLPADQQALLRRCHAGAAKLREIAAELQISANSLYLRLKRLRELLHACVDRALASQQRSDPA